MGNEIKLFAENSKEIDERRNARSDVTGTILRAMNSLSIDFGVDLSELTKLRIYRINQEEHALVRRLWSKDSSCIVPCEREFASMSYVEQNRKKKKFFNVSSFSTWRDCSLQYE